jgi:hypothetical protein
MRGDGGAILEKIKQKRQEQEHKYKHTLTKHFLTKIGKLQAYPKHNKRGSEHVLP